MKKKVFSIAAMVVLIIVSALFYITPKSFGKDVNPKDVDHINVFDGQTGTGFTITDPKDIKYIVENIQSHSMKRNGLVIDDVSHIGYYFSISYVDSENKDIVPIFFMIGDSTIIKRPFSYVGDGGLCFEYIRKLEPDLSNEVSVR